MEQDFYCQLSVFADSEKEYILLHLPLLVDQSKGPCL